MSGTFKKLIDLSLGLMDLNFSFYFTIDILFDQMVLGLFFGFELETIKDVRNHISLSI